MQSETLFAEAGGAFNSQKPLENQGDILGLVACSVPILILRMGWLNLKTILTKAPMFTVSHVVDTRMLENEAAAAAIA